MSCPYSNPYLAELWTARHERLCLSCWLTQVEEWLEENLGYVWFRLGRWVGRTKFGYHIFHTGILCKQVTTYTAPYTKETSLWDAGCQFFKWSWMFHLQLYSHFMDPLRPVSEDRCGATSMHLQRLQLWMGDPSCWHSRGWSGSRTGPIWGPTIGV